MTAPNIRNVATIIGKTAAVALTTTSATAILSNAASSGKVLKINSIYIANIDGTNTIDASLNFYSAAAIGGTAFALASTITIPADSTLVVISKEAPIYLEEDRSIGAIAAVASKLNVICSYEEIS